MTQVSDGFYFLKQLLSFFRAINTDLYYVSTHYYRHHFEIVLILLSQNQSDSISSNVMTDQNIFSFLLWYGAYSTSAASNGGRYSREMRKCQEEKNDKSDILVSSAAIMEDLHLYWAAILNINILAWMLISIIWRMKGSVSQDLKTGEPTLNLYDQQNQITHH